MKRNLCYSICLRCFTERLQKMFQKDISENLNPCPPWAKNYAEDLLSAHKRMIIPWYANIHALFQQQHKEHPCFFAENNIAHFYYPTLSVPMSLGGVKDAPNKCPYLLEHIISKKEPK